MKIRELFYLYRKQNKKGWLRFLAFVLMFVIAIVVIQVAIIENECIYYEINLVEKIMPERDHLYNIRLNTPEVNDEVFFCLEDYTNELKELEGVVAAGRYYQTNIVFEELLQNQQFLEMQRTLRQGTLGEAYPQCIDIVYMDEELLPMFSMDELPKGKEADASPVLVGAEYKDYLKVGQCFTDSVSQKKYEVVGVLPENYKLPSVSLFFSAELYLDMDKAIFALHDESFQKDILHCTDNIFCYSDGSKECLERVSQLAQEKNLRITIASVSELIEKTKEDNKQGMELQLLFTVVIVFSAFFAVVVTSVIRILLYKQEYGILYANGVSYKDTVKLFAMDHGIKLIVSFVIAFFVTQIYLRKVTLAGLEDMLQLFYTQGLWKSALIVVTMFVISTFTPMYLLRKLNVADLLGGNEL